jgi:hypothetical protein
MIWLALAIVVIVALLWALCRTAGELDRWEDTERREWEHRLRTLESLELYAEEPDEELQAILDMLEDALERRREAEQPQLRVVK